MSVAGPHIADGTRPAMTPKLFSGEVAVVSGAGQGLGSAFATALARSGCRVVALDLHASGLRSLADSLRGEGLACETRVLDVRDAAGCSEAVAAIGEDVGSIAVLVNNAGITSRAQLDDANFADEIDRVMEVNLKGVLNLTRAAVPQLKATKGTIVNIASIAALLASFASIPYAASKGAVAQATKFLARDLSPFGVRVNALAPGFVLTPLTSDLREGASSRMERAAQRTMLKRVATPEDLVGPLLFLASDLSRYITGLVVPVDGGYTAN
jgi:NAD(P)-dependent dehydrogenase (short-subunit alcohol dehydrogenase family)